MDTTIDQQVAMDEALVPTAQRLRIRRNNFRLLSDIKYKESTLQLIYDVLRICLFFKAFLVTADDPSIPRRNKVNWHYVRDNHMFSIIKLVSRHQNTQQFSALLPIELTNDEIKNSKAYKEYYAIAIGEEAPKPKASVRRTRSSSDTSITPLTIAASLRLSASKKGKQTAKASKAKSLSALFKVAITEAQQLKLVTKRGMQQIHISQPSGLGTDEGTGSKPGVLDVPTDESEEELSWNSTDDEGDDNEEKDDDGDEEDEGDDGEEGNGDDDDDDEDDDGEEGNDDDDEQEVHRDDDKDDDEEGEEAPKPKASVRRTRSSSDTSITPPTVAASLRLTASKKGKQTVKASKAKSLSALSEIAITEAQQLKLVTKRSMQQMHISQPSSLGTDEGTGSKPGVPDVPTDESEEELSWNSTDDEGDDNEEKDDDGDEEDKGNDDDDEQEVHRDDDKDDDEEGKGEEGLGLNVGGEEGHIEEEEEDELYKDTTSQLDVQTPTSVAPLPISAPTMTPSTIATITTISQAPIHPTTVSSTIIQNLPKFGSLFCFDDRLRSLETNFSKAMQTNQFASAVSAILGIVYRFMDQWMNEAVKVAIQIQLDHLREEAQRENDEFLKTVDENMKNNIKEQVKEKVKVQVSKILSRIEQAVNEQLKAEVLTRSSHSSRTSYAVAADLSEMELKKILIEKIEGKKSIQRSDEQRNLYKALVDDYESDKIILDTYRETVTLKRRREKARSLKEPMHTTSQMEEPSYSEFNTAVHGSIQPWITKLAKQADTRSSFNELMDTPLDFSNFLINRLKVDTLTPELLAGPTYELMKRSCKSLIKLEYHLEEVFKATTDQLEWVNLKGQQYPNNLATDYGYIKWIEDLVPRTMWIEESIGYDKHALWLMRIDELHKFRDRTLTDVRTSLADRLKRIRMQYLPQSIWRKGDKDKAMTMI
nr:hypothetical protein [Tanacetum cinerariifolium]